jgi:hypothetical protein
MSMRHGTASLKAQRSWRMHACQALLKELCCNQLLVAIQRHTLAIPDQFLTSRMTDIGAVDIAVSI